MATADDVTEELYCPICTDIYEDPLMLSCTHSFCRHCLQGRLQKGHVTKKSSGLVFDCPVCRKQILLDEDGLDGLPKNHLLRKMVGLYLTSTGSKPTARKYTMCDIHDKELGAFCDLCSEPLCIDCVVGEHKGHPIESVEDIYRKRKRLLEERNADITEDLKIIWNAKDTELQYIDQLEDCFKVKRDAIEGQFNDFMELLNQSKASILSEIDTRHKHDMVQALEGVTSIKTRETKLKEEMKEIKTLLKMNKMELLKMRSSKFNQSKSPLTESDMSPLMTSRSSQSICVPDCTLEIDGTSLTAIINDAHLVWEPDVDTCSPKHLADKMLRLYEQEWRAALQESTNKNKDDVIKLLLNLFIDTYRQARIICESQLDNLTYHVMQPDIDVVIGEYNIHGLNVNIEQEFKKSTLFCSVRESLRKIRAQHTTNISGDMIFTTYHDQTLKSSSTSNQRHLATYITKCFEIVYTLRIQDPPMFVPTTDSKPSQEVDKDVFKYVKRKGRKTNTFVWPPLYLYEGGPLLSKGIIFVPS